MTISLAHPFMHLVSMYANGFSIQTNHKLCGFLEQINIVDETRGTHWFTSCEFNDRLDRLMQREAAIYASRNVELWANERTSEPHWIKKNWYMQVFIRFELLEFVYTEAQTHTGIDNRNMQRYTICECTRLCVSVCVEALSIRSAHTMCAFEHAVYS